MVKWKKMNKKMAGIMLGGDDAFYCINHSICLCG